MAQCQMNIFWGDGSLRKKWFLGEYKQRPIAKEELDPEVTEDVLEKHSEKLIGVRIWVAAVQDP